MRNTMKKFTSQKEMIVSFQELCKQHHGVELSDQEALTEGMRLVNFITYMNPELATIKK